MIGLDSTFIIDLINGHAGARRRAQEIGDEPILVSSVAAFEIMLGIFQRNTPREPFDEFLDNSDVIDVDRSVANKAAQLQSQLFKKGRPISIADLLIVASYLQNGCNRVLTRDARFDQIPGIVVERY
ncbi:MAG TPA: type II toxin-antitoxin system VapC family toxin [Candidatus Nanoarchaeia archaeon]|nr:type II toxin-antitoxin system VapC family toxin [Candidatus Nanoarchaeia archaeon]